MMKTLLALQVMIGLLQVGIIEIPMIVVGDVCLIGVAIVQQITIFGWEHLSI